MVPGKPAFEDGLIAIQASYTAYGNVYPQQDGISKAAIDHIVVTCRLANCPISSRRQQKIQSASEEFAADMTFAAALSMLA